MVFHAASQRRRAFKPIRNPAELRMQQIAQDFVAKERAATFRREHEMNMDGQSDCGMGSDGVEFGLHLPGCGVHCMYPNGACNYICPNRSRSLCPNGGYAFSPGLAAIGGPTWVRRGVTKTDPKGLRRGLSVGAIPLGEPVLSRR